MIYCKICGKEISETKYILEDYAYKYFKIKDGKKINLSYFCSYSHYNKFLTELERKEWARNELEMAL